MVVESCTKFQGLYRFKRFSVVVEGCTKFQGL